MILYCSRAIEKAEVSNEVQAAEHRSCWQTPKLWRSGQLLSNESGQQNIGTILRQALQSSGSDTTVEDSHAQHQQAPQYVDVSSIQRRGAVPSD